MLSPNDANGPNSGETPSVDAASGLSPSLLSLFGAALASKQYAVASTIAFLGLADFALAQNCLAGDIEAQLAPKTALKAVTGRGDIIVGEGSEFESAELSTDLGEIHAKFMVAGAEFSFDTVSNKKAKLQVAVNDGTLHIAVHNMAGAYNILHSASASFSTEGDITEYKIRGTTQTGMVNYGNDLLDVDATNTDLNVNLIATFDDDPCPDDNCNVFELRFGAGAANNVGKQNICTYG